MEYFRNQPPPNVTNMSVAQTNMSLARGPRSQTLRGSDDDLTMRTNRVVKNQIVFRIKDARKPASRARRPATLNRQSAAPADPGFHSRKPHRKSRTGCGNCKKRRVKCDETKPHCQKCESYGVSCDYAAGWPQSRESNLLLMLANRSASRAGPIDASVLSMSITDQGDRIKQVLQSASTCDADPEPLPSFTMDRAPFALQCFIDTVGFVASLSDSSRKVVKGDMLRLAFRTPYLMHAILGVACTSLYQFSAYDKSQKIAEAYHWQKAINLYKKEIQGPIGAHNMDGLMSTCMMMGVLSFSEKEYSPFDSWVFTSRPTDLNWLLVQGGLRFLIESVAPWLPQSIWFEFFMESDDENKTFDDHRPGPVGLHPELAELCEIDETTTEDDNPYHWPLRMLTPLLDTPMVREHFSKFSSFMGRLLPDYVSLLHRKDARACLILAFWMGKMCEEKWWIYPRMQAECTALCMFLEHNEDPRILKLLRYPASKCGYILRYEQQQPLLMSNLDFSELLL